MKVKDILLEFNGDLKEFLEFNKENESDDDFFYIMIDDSYFAVDMNNSYWYFEDDGTVVFRVNDMTGE